MPSLVLGVDHVSHVEARAEEGHMDAFCSMLWNASYTLGGSLLSASADERVVKRVCHRAKIDCVSSGWITLNLPCL